MSSFFLLFAKKLLLSFLMVTGKSLGFEQLWDKGNKMKSSLWVLGTGTCFSRTSGLYQCGSVIPEQ